MADVLLNLLGESAAIDVNLVDAIHGEEFQGVFDEWRVGERKQTLSKSISVSYMRSAQTIADCFFPQRKPTTYSRSVYCEWPEAVLE